MFDEPVRKAEAVLLCGWRRDLADMIKELDAAAPPNSEIWLLNTGTPVLALLVQKYWLYVNKSACCCWYGS